MNFAMTPLSAIPLNVQGTSSLDPWVVNSEYLLHTPYSQPEQTYWFLTTLVNFLLELSSGLTLPTLMQLYSTQYNVVCKMNVCWPSEYSVLRDFLLLKSLISKLYCMSLMFFCRDAPIWYAGLVSVLILARLNLNATAVVGFMLPHMKIIPVSVRYTDCKFGKNDSTGIRSELGTER